MTPESRAKTGGVTEAKRGYHSPARTAAAQETRRRILEAARRLFAARGYGATTLAVIAADAGVAVATVRQIFGGKAGLVRAQLDRIDEAGGVPELRAVLSNPASTPRDACVALARFLRKLYNEVGPLMAAVGAAGGADEQLRAIAEGGAQRHRRGIVALTAQWAQSGVLRSGLEAEQAAAIVAAIASYDTHRNLRQDWGWTSAQYETWVAEALESLVLARDPHPSEPGAG